MSLWEMLPGDQHLRMSLWEALSGDQHLRMSLPETLPGDRHLRGTQHGLAARSRLDGFSKQVASFDLRDRDADDGERVEDVAHDDAPRDVREGQRHLEAERVDVVRG